MKKLASILLTLVVVLGLSLVPVASTAGGAVFAGTQGLEEVAIGGEDEITKGKEVVELSEGQVIPVKRAEGFPLKGEKEANEPGPVRVTEIHTMLEKASVNLGEVTIEGSISPNGELPVAKEQIELETIEVREAEEVTKGYILIGGTIAPSQYHFYGPYWYDAGEVVTISISWAPPESVFRIGLTSEATGIFYYCEVYNGSGTCYCTVNVPGWYYPTVNNVGPYTATYSGYVGW